MAVQVYGTYIQFNDGTTQSTAAASSSGIARAWVTFVLGSTPTISGSGNVSSVTYNAASDWTVNFTSSLPDANYAVVASCQTDGGNRSLGFGQYSATQPTTTSCRMKYYDSQIGQGNPGTKGYIAFIR